MTDDDAFRFGILAQQMNLSTPAQAFVRPDISFAPPGLGAVCDCNPRLKPWATVGRPCRDFEMRAIPGNEALAPRA